MMESCSTCRMFVPGALPRPTSQPHDGACHAAPPMGYNAPWPDDDAEQPVENDDDGGTVVTLTIRDSWYTGWPLVRASDWCGHWAPLDLPERPAAECVSVMVRRLRRSLDLTQQQLADRVAWNRTTVTKIEAGRRPLRAHEVEPLARALGVDPLTLLDGA